jgi:cobalt transporter subunit CbtB
MSESAEPSGVKARSFAMNTLNATAAPSSTATGIGAMIAVALIGLGIIFITGHVQADALHVAAHDVRHATGFPCH